MLIKNAVVVTLDEAGRVYDPGWLLLEGHSITQVGEGEPPSGVDHGEVIDADGMIAMPGLVNTHVHSFQTLLRGFYDHLPLSEYLSYVYRCGIELSTADAEVAARLAAAEALRAGVTTLVDHHFLNRQPELAMATLQGMLDIGVRGVLARTTMDTGDGLPTEILEQPARAFQDVDGLLAAFAEPIATGRVRVMSGPNTPGINASAAAVRSIAEFSRDRGLRMSAHVAEYAEVRASVLRSYGVDGVVRWLDGLGALGEDLLAVHAVHVDDAEIELFRRSEVAISHNPFSNLFCGPVTAPVSKYLEAGLRVGVGTDGAANNNGLDVFDAVRVSRILERANPDRPGMSVSDTLRLASTGGAAALGMSDMIGSLEPGKRADIVLISKRAPHMSPMFDPTAHLGYFGKGSDVDTVIVDGEVRLRNRAFVQTDLQQLLAIANVTATRLIDRL